MSKTLPASPMRIAKILNIILVIIIACLALGAMAFLVFAVAMQFPNGFRDSAIAAIQSQGGEMPGTKGLVVFPLTAAILAGAYLYVAIVVRAIVKTTLDGDPFVETNISRLRKTWIVIALAEIFRMLVMNYMPAAPDQAGAALNNFALDTRLSVWFLVFVIAAMAEVFRIGLELRRDQEFTV